MQPIQPEPWSLGVRLHHEPSGLGRYPVAAGAPADGCTIADLAVGEDVWISVVIRDGHLVPVHGSTRLQAGDEVLALTDPDHTQNLTRSSPPSQARPGAGSLHRALELARAIEMEETRSSAIAGGTMPESNVLGVSPPCWPMPATSRIALVAANDLQAQVPSRVESIDM